LPRRNIIQTFSEALIYTYQAKEPLSLTAYKGGAEQLAGITFCYDDKTEVTPKGCSGYVDQQVDVRSKRISGVILSIDRYSSTTMYSERCERVWGIKVSPNVPPRQYTN
jgi:hypothetical protein